MRTLLIGMGLAGLLVAGCDSSDNGDGGSTTGGSTTTTSGTTGGATTGGASTGGTTAGTTGGSTSGTTTGTTGGGLAPGDPCVADAQCATDVCGVNGSGNCCSTACSTSDATCGATGCDNSGACVYPAGGGACGTDSCSADMLTRAVCSGQGSCVSNAASPCPNNFACQDASSCKTTCDLPADCASGFYCDTGTHACLAQQATGPCASNAACTSGVCGIAGTGNCCSVACNISDATCGATACDVTGACSYPPATVACGIQSCTGSTQTNPAVCDGLGNCPPPGTTDCTPFVCGTTDCLTSCTDSTSCVGGGFCDTTSATCCSGLVTGGTLNVDSTTGADAACCGIGSNGACQTLGRAMKLIDNAQAQNVTINATVNGAGGDWAAKGETYPIVLGWGVELNAPGVFFLDDIGFNAGTPNNQLFDIAQYSPLDTVGYASIVGAAGNKIAIGMDQASDQSLDYSSIQIEAGQTLYIANASVNGSANNFTTAFTVNAGGTLWFGQDQSGGVTGTVQIGNTLNQFATDGFEGVFCASDFASVGCTIKDTALAAGQSSVIIQGQEYIDMEIYDYSVISLTSAPIIGLAPAAAGFGQCSGKPDVSQYTADVGGLGPAVLLVGPATMTFNNGTIQCITGAGFDLEPSGPNNVRGGPTLTMDGTTIQNTDLGIEALAGTATVTNSTIQYNFSGVVQYHYDADNSDATIDLSGGGNTVVCSSNQEFSSGPTTNEGVGVWNQSKANLPADNVAWDTTAPDYFSCDNGTASTGNSCTCLSTTCSNTAPFDGMDALEDSTNLGGITTTGNTLSSITCN